MIISLKVKGIGLSKYETDEYISISLYMIRKKDDDLETYTYAQRKLYWMDGFKANVLIGNNIIGPESIFINISHKFTYISSYKIKIFIQAK